MSNEGTPDMFPETINSLKFKRGDVVHLNSAKPWMIVAAANGQHCTCLWFLEDYSLTSAEIHEDCLTLIKL